ncbi:MOSC N-terminal beta barrel domain-containing protein [Actinomycetes bacterium KLBMP 9759]
MGEVGALRRYPVKSMLGEDLAAVRVAEGGLDGDRALALIDTSSGRIATAKHPRLWRRLLQLSATRGDDGSVSITLPDGTAVDAAGARVSEVLSEVLGRPVRLAAERPDGASVERPAPEDVIESGVEAKVPYATVEIALGTPGGTFVDHSPVHLITTATVEHIGTEAVRYRPNVVVATPPGPPFAENGWRGREVTIGEVRLRVTVPTPRCSVPTLEHGELPRALHAVRTPLAENRIDVLGTGAMPCAGVYAEVVSSGTIHTGDPVLLADA